MLKTCYNCIRHGISVFMPEEPRKMNALSLFTSLAKNGHSAQVRIEACQCIMIFWYIKYQFYDDSFYPEIKADAVKDGTVQILISLLKHKCSNLRGVAVGALMR